MRTRTRTMQVRAVRSQERARDAKARDDLSSREMRTTREGPKGTITLFKHTTQLQKEICNNNKSMIGFYGLLYINPKPNNTLKLSWKIRSSTFQVFFVFRCCCFLSLQIRVS